MVFNVIVLEIDEDFGRDESDQPESTLEDDLDIGQPCCVAARFEGEG